MFRKLLTQARVNFGVAQYCSRPARRTFTDLNEVKLVGTLIDEPYVLASGTKQLTIKTVGEHGFSHHTIRIPKLFSDLTVGSRVFVTGPLHSVPFEIDTGKTRESAIVIAEEVFVLNDEDGTTYKDQNVVEIVGNVIVDAYIKDNFCLFNIATNYNAPTPNGDESHTQKTNYHTVVVFDDQARSVAKTVKKGDRVILKGKLEYNFGTTAEGKKLSQGRIVPHTIFKLACRNKENNNVEDTNVESEAKD